MSGATGAHRTGSAVSAALLLLTMLGAGSAAHALEQPEVKLFWNAPAGRPGAASNLTPACADTTRADTLYLTFRLEEDYDAFTGYSAIVMFHTAFGDTLPPYWKTTEYPEKPGHLRVEFPNDTGDAGFRAPTASVGFGDYAYYTEEQRAIVRVIFAVPPFAAAPIAGGRDYCIARIIIRHSLDRAGCDLPMCAEFFDADFKFSLNQPAMKGRQVHASFASINSASGVSCAQHRLVARQRGVVKSPPLPRGGRHLVPRFSPDSADADQR